MSRRLRDASDGSKGNSLERTKSKKLRGNLDPFGPIGTLAVRDVKNILQNAARLGAGQELVRKAISKYLEPADDAQQVLEWCNRHASEICDWLPSEHTELWEEAQLFAQQMNETAADMLRGLDVQLGGGGHYGLLYFLTRAREPEIVVETGVAAGYSSKAILSAMKRNNRGSLRSSDFPYCRLEHPEKYIGILVDEDLRQRWALHIKGDRKNLEAIASGLSPESVGLFHYDSDKSYSGREFAFRTIQPYLSPDSICIFDDIQNNWHFRDLVDNNPFDWRIFEFGGKYLGLLQRADPKAE